MLQTITQQLQRLMSPNCMQSNLSQSSNHSVCVFCVCQVLASAVEPASDVWAAGVMAYQLLSGRFPFDDWQHPDAPALSLVRDEIAAPHKGLSTSCGCTMLCKCCIQDARASH
jgi:serine/threonine protein kinase